METKLYYYFYKAFKRFNEYTAFLEGWLRTMSPLAAGLLTLH